MGEAKRRAKQAVVKCMEAITSGSLLLTGIGHAVKHAGQTTLYLTAMYAASQHLITLISNIHAALAHVKAMRRSCPSQPPGTFCWITSYPITRRPPPIYTRIFTL
jgi:hypothetical protein